MARLLLFSLSICSLWFQGNVPRENGDRLPRRPVRRQRLDLRAPHCLAGIRSGGELPMDGAKDFVRILVGDDVQRADHVTRPRGEKSAAEAEAEALTVARRAERFARCENDGCFVVEPRCCDVSP